MGAVRAVLLDVGGVLLLPDPEVVGAALAAADVPHDARRVHEAHYLAAAALMPEVVSSPYTEQVPHYAAAFVSGLGVPERDRVAAAQALEPVWRQPAPTLWRTVVPGSARGLSDLAATGATLAVVSNADGSVEDQLRAHELCQTGPGPGVEVAAVLDSAVVGVAKPDPRIFELALETLAIEPGDALYVGDTAAIDVAGACAAGIAAIHFDPFGVCPDGNHAHATSLSQVAASVADGGERHQPGRRMA